jgi:hypothetical protein
MGGQSTGIKVYLIMGRIKMWNDNDMREGETWHKFNLDMIDREKGLVQYEILRMYNDGEINGQRMVEKMEALNVVLKVMYDTICDLHNLTELV